MSCTDGLQRRNSANETLTADKPLVDKDELLLRSKLFEGNSNNDAHNVQLFCRKEVVKTESRVPPRVKGRCPKNDSANRILQSTTTAGDKKGGAQKNSLVSRARSGWNRRNDENSKSGRRMEH